MYSPSLLQHRPSPNLNNEDAQSRLMMERCLSSSPKPQAIADGIVSKVVYHRTGTA